MPEYMAALLAASTAQSADMFRKLYYDNGSHAGCIVYIGAGQVDDKSMKAVKETLTGARGKGAFKTCCCMHRGGKDGVQILPFQQITAKDEFINIKKRHAGRHTRGAPYPAAADGRHAGGKRIFRGYRESRPGLRYQRADARNGGAEGGQRVARRRGDPFQPICVAYPEK